MKSIIGGILILSSISALAGVNCEGLLRRIEGGLMANGQCLAHANAVSGDELSRLQTAQECNLRTRSDVQRSILQYADFCKTYISIENYQQ